MATYVVAQLDVHDPTMYREYATQVAATAAPFGGKFLAANDADVKEGEPPALRTIVGEFPSSDEANAWYESDEYQKILPLRLESTNSVILFVEGFSMPPIETDGEG
jgi:uncharacterized protein (DUF1330 family)